MRHDPALVERDNDGRGDVQNPINVKNRGPAVRPPPAMCQFFDDQPVPAVENDPPAASPQVETIEGVLER